MRGFCSISDPSDFPYVIYYATFPAGTSQGLQQCVNINTVNDMDVENNEAFTVNLLAANSSAVTIGDRSGGKTATITINDNDGKKLLGTHSMQPILGKLFLVVHTGKLIQIAEQRMQTE